MVLRNWFFTPPRYGILWMYVPPQCLGYYEYFPAYMYVRMLILLRVHVLYFAICQHVCMLRYVILRSRLNMETVISVKRNIIIIFLVFLSLV